MKYLALGCLILAVTAIGAQALEELPELDGPAQAEELWDSIYQELREQPLSLEGRTLLTPDNSQIQTIARFQLHQAELLALYNYKFSDSVNSGSFRLGLTSPEWEAALGGYRFRFGRGIVSGSASRAQPDSLFSLLEPLSPRNYGPLGAALTFRHRSIRAAVFASKQNREARIDAGGNILSLGKTRTGRLSTAQESILGATAGIMLPRVQAGALCYWRQYDRDFAAAGISRSLWAGSVFAMANWKKLSLDAEIALAKGTPSALLTFRYKVKNFDQSISYARNSQEKLLPYALTPAVLSPASGRDELSSDLVLGLPLKTTLKLRYTLNSGSGFSGGVLSRFMGSLGYNEKDEAFKLVIHSYDREIITLADSNYVATDPRNYRLQLTGRYRVLPRIRQYFDFSYSLKDRAQYSQNSYRVSFGMQYRHKALTLDLGYLTWQNLNGFWQNDELDPYSSSLCAAEDKLLALDIAWRGGHWKLSLQGQKSLLV